MAKPIALAADHGGFELKEAVKAHLDEAGIPYIDFGTHSTDSVDYPDMAVPACDAVVSGQCDKALLFCGTGVGISMAANKVKGIRACCCSDSFSCEYTRRHNDANTLCMGGRVVGAVWWAPAWPASWWICSCPLPSREAATAAASKS